MKRFLLISLALILSIGACMAQNFVKCKKQESLTATKTSLNKKYGAEQVRNALNGEISIGMPEALFLKAFNTESVKYDAEGCKAYNVYNDDILKRRRPNEAKPDPIYFVIISENKVVKIKPGEKNTRFKVRNGAVIY